MTVAEKRDLRAEWANNDQLVKSVRNELRNWAIWSHGGLPRIGYARKVNFYDKMKGASSDPTPPPCEVDKAEETEGFFRLWRTLARESKPEAKARLAGLLLALKLHYLTDKPAHIKARIVGVSRREFYRMIDEAEYRYWVIRS